MASFFVQQREDFQPLLREDGVPSLATGGHEFVRNSVSAAGVTLICFFSEPSACEPCAATAKGKPLTSRETRSCEGDKQGTVPFDIEWR
jgi:hypothetical protein